MKKAVTITITSLILTSIISGLAAQQAGEGCGSSGPRHYFNISMTDHPEKLTFLINEDLIVAVECKEILLIPVTQLIDSVVSDFQQRLMGIEDSLNTFKTPLLIKFHHLYNGLVKLSVIRKDSLLYESVGKSGDETYQNTFFKYTIEYPVDESNTLVIYTNRLNFTEFISVSDIRGHVIKAQADIISRDIPRFAAKTCTYIIKDGIIDLNAAHIHKYADRGIGITLNTGLSYLNGEFVPSISFPVVYMQSRKQGKPIQVGISFDILLSIDKEKQYRIRDNWYAEALIIPGKSYPTFFAGYLIHREGDLLPPDACRIGVDIPVTKSGNIRLRNAFHFSLTHPGQNLFETGIRVGR